MRNRQMDCRGRVVKVDAGNLLVSSPCSLGLTKSQASVSGHIGPFYGFAHFPFPAPSRARKRLKQSTPEYHLYADYFMYPPYASCSVSFACFLHAKRYKTPRRCCAGTHRARASSSRSPSNKLSRWDTGRQRSRKLAQLRGTCRRLNTVELANQPHGQIGLAARQQTIHCGARRCPFPLLGFLDTLAGSTTPAYPAGTPPWALQSTSSFSPVLWSPS